MPTTLRLITSDIYGDSEAANVWAEALQLMDNCGLKRPIRGAPQPAQSAAVKKQVKGSASSAGMVKAVEPAGKDPKHDYATTSVAIQCNIAGEPGAPESFLPGKVISRSVWRFCVAARTKAS